MAYDEKLLERIRATLSGRRDVVEKKMFGGVAFMVGGHMSCGIQDASLMVRLAPQAADAFLNTPGVRAMDFTGRPMRGFLYVDAPAISTAGKLKTWVDRTVAHAQSLPKKVKKPAARKRA